MKWIPKRYRLYFRVAFIACCNVCLLFIAYYSYNEARPEYDKLTSYTGKIKSIELLSADKDTAKDFYYQIRLDKFSKSFQFQQSENAEELFDNLYVGDTITIYYTNDPKSTIISNIYQLQRAQELLYNTVRLRHEKESIALFAVLTALSITLFFIWPYLKRKRFFLKK